MKLERIHHVAYRCKDARETVEWYGKYLNMGFVLAIAEDHVPSTHAPDPYMHVFLDAGGGNVLAFFEIPNSPPTPRRPTCSRAWTRSSGRCSRSGAGPGARPSTRPGCTSRNSRASRGAERRWRAGGARARLQISNSRSTSGGTNSDVHARSIASLRRSSPQ